jgi:hypothetical protein
MWTQIVGKIRLARSPWVNHSWHAALYVSARGLTTSAIPHDDRSFQIDFDFIDHELVIATTEGDVATIPLQPQTTAAFYETVMMALDDLSVPVSIHVKPNEVEPAIPFPEDVERASYDPEYAHRFWRVLAQSDRILKIFRARFIGKASPVHFFWGSFDLAVSRFCGRPAPEHKGGFPNMPLRVMQEAYSQEVSSAGFWPGGEAGEAFYYSYIYPTPEGFAESPVAPAAASWNAQLGEFILPYEAVRTAEDPERALLSFLESTYEAAAATASWDRSVLEQTFEP